MLFQYLTVMQCAEYLNSNCNYHFDTKNPENSYLIYDFIEELLREDLLSCYFFYSGCLFLNSSSDDMIETYGYMRAKRQDVHSLGRGDLCIPYKIEFGFYDDVLYELHDPCFLNLEDIRFKKDDIDLLFLETIEAKDKKLETNPNDLNKVPHQAYRTVDRIMYAMAQISKLDNSSPYSQNRPSLNAEIQTVLDKAGIPLEYEAIGKWLTRINEVQA